MALALVSATGLIWVRLSRRARTTGTASDNSTEPTDDVARLREDTGRELHLLRQEFRARDQLWQELARTREAEKQTPQGLATKDASPVIDLAELEAAEKRANEAIVARLAAEFRTQSFDPAWSKAATEQAKLGIGRHLRSDSTLGVVECRRTLCQISSSHKTRAAFMEYAREVLAGRDSGLWNGAMSAFVTREDSTSVDAVAYVAREGHSFPSPDL